MIGQLIASVAGLVVMMAPSLVGYGGLAADIDHIIGPVAIAVGIMAASQILRSMRWLQVGLGGLLLGSMFFVTRPATALVAVALATATLIFTAVVRGSLDVDFGGGWSSLWREEKRVH
ncbi:MAG: hypothetical protein M3285_07065 [Actinomycetota bacterium]|nr:hypothetical protein [Actinomycetota bacterium]